MLRILLLLFGFCLLLFQQFLLPVNMEWQFLLFTAGVILLGIPHGAVDLLVASNTAIKEKRPFSNTRFFKVYLSRLIIFGLVIYLMPVPGMLIFILFSAYHFGETDLYFLRTDTIPGKILVGSYGLVILTVILLSNLSDLRSLLQYSGSSAEVNNILDFLESYRSAGLSITLVLFFSSIFFYFLITQTKESIPDFFLLQFAILVFVLYQLPLILGFTFYFVVWHSVLSLKNIIHYLRRGNAFTMNTIIRQIMLYSGLATGGIVITGVAGYFFISDQAIIMYVFLSLAVLTAPHMQIMHDMYRRIRGPL